LRSSDYRIVYEQKVLASYKLVNGYLLHLCNLVSVRLLSGHETSRPGGSVLYKRPCKGYAAAVCVSYGVRSSGIRHSANVIYLRKVAAVYIVLSHYSSVAV